MRLLAWFCAVFALVSGLVAVGPFAPKAAAAPPLDAPVLNDVSYEFGGPLLSWSAVTGATGYRVQIATDAEATAIAYTKDTVSRRLAPEKRLPKGPLWWRVIALSGSTLGTPSDTSELDSAAPGPPEPLSPLGPVPDPAANPPIASTTLSYPSVPPVFRWTAAANASTYLLEIDTVDDFAHPQQITTANLSYALTEPQKLGQNYYWHVRAQSADQTVVSEWSDTQAYSYTWDEIPRLSLGDDDRDGVAASDPDAPRRNVRLEWTVVLGAKAYQLQVSPNQSFTNNLTVDREVIGTSYTPDKPFANGGYFWRVRAIDAAATRNYGAWSTTGRFLRGWLDAPRESTPLWRAAEKETAESPAVSEILPTVSRGSLFSWSPIEHASVYELQFATDENFSKVAFECYTNHPSWVSYARISTTSAGEPNASQCTAATRASTQIVVPWAAGTKYFWRVRGIDFGGSTGGNANNGNSGNNLSAWSTSAEGPSRFVYQPSVAQLFEPENETSVSIPKFAWGVVAGANSYVLNLTTANGASVAGFPVTTSALSYTPDQVLADGEYAWTVTANGSVSETYKFTIQNDNEASATSIRSLVPRDNATTRRAPALSWSPVAGAKSYLLTLTYIDETTQTPQTQLIPLAYPSFTQVSALLPRRYVWSVDALDERENVIASGPANSFRVTPQRLLGTNDYLSPQQCNDVENCTAEGDTPTFRWAGDPDATYYDVVVANDPHFTNVLRKYRTVFTSLTPSESFVDNQAGGPSYYWFVRPCFGQPSDPTCGPDAGTETASNSYGTFRKESAPVRDIELADASAGNQLTFTWDDYQRSEQRPTAPRATQEASAYHLEISDRSDFAVLLDSATINGGSYTSPTKTYPDGPIFWRVQAVDPSGNKLTWSDPNAGMVAKSSAKPGNLCTTEYTDTQSAATSPCTRGSLGTHSVPSLSWNAVPYAAKYDVEVYKGGDQSFAPGNRVFRLTAGTKYAAATLTAGLPADTYAWRVRATDGGGQTGSWTSGSTFPVGTDQSIQQSPPDKSTTNTPDVQFTWRGTPTAAQYRWQLSSSPSFTSITQSATTAARTWVPTTALPDGKYYWRVQVLDGSGNVTSKSAEMRSIEKDGTAPRVTTKSPTASAPLTGPFTVSFSEPVTGVDSSSLQLLNRDTTTPVSSTTSPAPEASASTATVTPVAPLVPGQTYRISVGGKIADLFGNPVTPMFWDVRTNTTVDNASSAVTEVWSRQGTSAASGSSYDLAKTAGSSAVFRFSGSNVSVVGTKMPAGGYARVILDGATKTSTASFYASRVTYKQSIWSVSGLTSGPHTLQVVVMGTRPSGATDSWVSLDAFKIGSVVTEQTSSAVREYFKRASTTSASAGSYDYSPHTTASGRSLPFYEVKFRGTGVSVYGVRSTTSGNALMYVDGVKRATVSFRGTTAYGVQLYSSPTLSDGPHTLRVYVAGTSNGASSTVGLDHVVIR